MPTYAVITPARDEAGHLLELAASLRAQTLPPTHWVIVDNGSEDETPEVAAQLGRELPWTQLATVPGVSGQVRGGPVVRAFHAGVDALAELPDFVAKVDADITFEPDFFERLLGAFAADPQLGMASGACYERQGGEEWLPRYGTGDNVWGAARAYRRECLEQILPLDARMGWDAIDVLKANTRGWRTTALLELPFRHHRPEGVRDSGGARQAWASQGRAAHYMGYRLSYLLFRTLYRLRREPAAGAMLSAYVRCMVTRDERCPDTAVRQRVRSQQRLRHFPMRVREALGRAAA